MVFAVSQDDLLDDREADDLFTMLERRLPTSPPDDEPDRRA